MKYYSILIGALLSSTAATTAVQAREPGLGPSYIPGKTIGTPTALPLPTEFMFNMSTSYADNDLYDANGNKTGDTFGNFSEILRFQWQPGFEVLGGKYRTGLTVPILNVNADKVNPVYGAVGDYSEMGIGNIEVTLADISWRLGNGWWLSSGINVFTPLSSYDESKAVKIGNPFWTFEPNVALNYANDGWLAAVDLRYTISTKNTTTDYRSGDQLFAHAWVTKEIGGFSLGPAVYYNRQVTDDRNSGKNYGGRTVDMSEQFGIGAIVGRRFEKFSTQLVYTHEVVAKNSQGGDKIWLKFSVPFGEKAAR